MPNPWDSLPDANSAPAKGNPWDALPNAEEGSGWDEVNSDRGAVAENNATRESRKKKSFIQRVYDNANAKYEEQQKEPFGTRLKKSIGNLGLGPVNQALSSINDVASPILEEAGAPDWLRLPSGNLAGGIKGAAAFPVGVSRRLYSTFMPGSNESRYAGEMAKYIDDESKNYDKSVTGEMAGQGIMAAGLPGGPVLDRADKLGRFSMGLLKGAGQGLADPGWDTTSEDEYRNRALPAAIVGGAAGALGEFTPEIIQTSRDLGNKLRDPAKRFKELVDSIGGKPKNVIPEELRAEKISRIKALDAEFADALALEGHIKPDVSPIITKIDENLAKLNPKIEQDTALIGRLQSMRQRLVSGAPVTQGSRYEQLIANAQGNAAGAPDLSIKGLSDWRRLVGQRQQVAFDTAGNPIQVTPSREAGEAVRSIKNSIDESIFRASPQTDMALAQTRSNWKQQMAPFIPDELGQDPIGRIMKTSTPDVELRSLVGTKSEDAAARVLTGATPRAREALQAEILSDAMKFRAKDGPAGFAKALTDEHGELIPAAYQAFQGADRDMLKGAVKIANIADKLGKATNIGIGAGVAGLGGSSAGAAMGSPGLGGGMGVLAGGWAGRKWLPNWSAGGWEKLIRNPGTRGMMVLLGKLPEDSPEAQKIVTSLMANPAWNE